MYSIAPDMLMKDVKKTDLIIIPAMHGDLPSAIETNKEFFHG